MSVENTSLDQLEVLLRRAEDRYDKRDYAGAIKFYDKILAIDTSDTWSLWERGLMKKKKKDYAGALKDFKKVIDIDKDHTYAYYQIALINEKNGNKKEAKKNFTFVEELRSKNST